MLEEKSELKKILDTLNLLKDTKQLSNNQTELIISHINTINEILDKNLVYNSKMIEIYKQIVEVFSDEQENIWISIINRFFIAVYT